MLSTAFVVIAVIAAWFGAAGTDSFHWRGKVPAGQFVEIRGINGNIHAEPAAGKDVEVVAYKTGQVYDSAGIQVQVVEHNGGITICQFSLQRIRRRLRTGLACQAGRVRTSRSRNPRQL